MPWDFGSHAAGWLKQESAVLCRGASHGLGYESICRKFKFYVIFLAEMLQFETVCVAMAGGTLDTDLSHNV